MNTGSAIVLVFLAAGVTLAYCTTRSQTIQLESSPVIPTIPDVRLTPGAVIETDPAVICAPGYDRMHRVWHDKASTLAKYGLPRSMARRVEDDDLIPVCAGGDNANPLNHWTQRCDSWDGDRCVKGPAALKDGEEASLCRKMCDNYRRGAGGYTPEEVQTYFRTLQWVPK